MKAGCLPALLRFTFDDWDTGNYVFAPCHIYGGNRFRIHKIGYPPYIDDETDRPLDMPITMTNIPHLSNDGSDAYIDFKTNSCSTPLAVFYDKGAKKGFSILIEQGAVLGDEAFFICEYPSEKRLTIRLSAPGVREHRYVITKSDYSSDDEGIVLKRGDEIMSQTGGMKIRNMPISQTSPLVSLTEKGCFTNQELIFFS